jgi:hypothetical protein
MTLQLENRSAVIVALIGPWLLACLGVFVVLHAGDWHFIPSNDRSLVTAQIGWFYLAIFGGQVPAIAFVALIVNSFKFRRPILVGGLVTLTYQLTMLITEPCFFRASFGLPVTAGESSASEYWPSSGCRH